MQSKEESGEKIVETEKRKTLLIEPWKVAERDPPLSEWLRLEVSEACPACYSESWSVINPIGYLPVRRCKDQHNIGCEATWREPPNPFTIIEIGNAMMGIPKRLAR